MAEFCFKCSNKLGLKYHDSKPLFCENCQTYYTKVSLIDRLKAIFKK